MLKVIGLADVPINYTGCIIDSVGSKYWYENGLNHRENDLPAIEYPDGAKVWKNNGKFHRENDLPTIEWPDGTKYWFIKDELHRENAPAILRANGTAEWYIHGIKQTFEEL
jgi:hypothetical protein